METRGATDIEDIGIFQIVHKANDVRHAGVEEMEVAGEAFDFSGGVEREIFRFRHGDADFFADDFRGEGSGDGFKRNAGRKFFIFVAKVCGEETKATRAVAAHFRFAAIGVVVTEFVIGSFFRWLHRQQSIRTNPAMTIAERGDGVIVEGDREVAVIDDDEIVTGAIHFVEV